MSELEITAAITALSTKVDKLAQTVISQNEIIRNLEEKNRLLQSSLEEEKKMHHRALQDSEFLAVSHKLADDADNIIKARKKISALIRTIDNCIRKINED